MACPFCICVALAPDGASLAVVYQDGTVKIWDIGLRMERIALKCGSSVQALAFARDGRVLLATCHDGTVHPWHADPSR